MLFCRTTITLDFASILIDTAAYDVAATMLFIRAPGSAYPARG